MYENVTKESVLKVTHDFGGFAQIEEKKESLTLSPMERMVREYESEEKWAESNAYIYYSQQIVYQHIEWNIHMQ